MEFLKVPPKIKTESEKKNKTKLKFHDELFKTARKESDKEKATPERENCSRRNEEFTLEAYLEDGPGAIVP